MSVSYTASAFYGTYCDQDSKIGKRLNTMVDEFGSTLCPVKGHPQVGIGNVGVVNGSPAWITIQLKQPTHDFGRHDEIGEPQPMTPQCLGTIEAALRTLKIKAEDVAPIGWYFASSVS